MAKDPAWKYLLDHAVDDLDGKRDETDVAKQRNTCLRDYTTLHPVLCLSPKLITYSTFAIASVRMLDLASTG